MSNIHNFCQCDMGITEFTVHVADNCGGTHALGARYNGSDNALVMADHKGYADEDRVLLRINWNWEDSDMWVGAQWGTTAQCYTGLDMSYLGNPDDQGSGDGFQGVKLRNDCVGIDGILLNSCKKVKIDGKDMLKCANQIADCPSEECINQGGFSIGMDWSVNLVKKDSTIVLGYHAGDCTCGLD